MVKIHTAEPLSPISVGDYLYEARLPAARGGRKATALVSLGQHPLLL